jgi:hypothetical protein
VTTTNCTLDTVILASCASPQTVNVASGAHRFTVTVANQSGSASASYRWFVQ